MYPAVFNRLDVHSVALNSSIFEKIKVCANCDNGGGGGGGGGGGVWGGGGEREKKKSERKREKLLP
jgi:hypothetical protein